MRWVSPGIPRVDYVNKHLQRKAAKTFQIVQLRLQGSIVLAFNGVMTAAQIHIHCASYYCNNLLNFTRSTYQKFYREALA